MATKKPQYIEITHFINPHLFWYKIAGKSNESQKTVIEHNFSEFAKRCYNQNCAKNFDAKISVSDNVAVYYLKEKKWIRATVDKFDPSEGSMILWADDYGIPLECSRNLVMTLDDELKLLCSKTKVHVYQGGIHGVIPASYGLNSEKELITFLKKHWNDNVVQNMKKIIDEKKCEFQFTWVDFAEGSDFGDLMFITPSKSDMAKSYLIKARFAQAVDDFPYALTKIATIQIERWLDNNFKSNCVSNEGQLPDDCTSSDLPRIARLMISNTFRKKMQNEKGDSVHSQSSSAKHSQCSDVSNDVKAINSPKINSPDDNKLKSSQTDASNKNETVPQSKKLEMLRRFRGITKSEPDPSGTEQKSIASKNISNSKTDVVTKESEKRPSIISKISQPVTAVPKIRQLNEHSGLICRANWQPIFLQNNEEYPIESIKDANFTQSAFKGMKNANLMEVYSLQTYAWPNILRGNSVLMIESKNRGKTLAYLPALCSSVRRDQENNAQINGQLGTLAVIVSMSDSIPMIARYCREFLDNANYRNTVIEGVRGEDGNVEGSLCYGCSILVTSVPCLQRLMDNEFMINNDKLKYIAIENIDVLLEKYSSNLPKLLSKLAFDKSKNPRQLMVTSRIWHPQFKEFIDKCDAVMMIGNFFEAAAYLKIKTEFKFCLTTERREKVLERINSIAINKEKTLIICEKFEEIQDVASFLDSTGIAYRVAQNLESEFEFGKLKSYWNSNKGIVICCDETVNDTKIRNAIHVIHYSLPSSNFRCFENRFITQIELSSSSLGTSWALFNENNQRQFPKIMDLLRRYQQKVPKHFEEIDLKIRSEMNNLRQLEHQFEPVCNHVFLHGNTEHNACMNRHKLLPTDIATGENLYVNQELRFHLFKVISPSEYVVRPLKLRTISGWKNIMRSDEYAVFKMGFHLHYVKPENQVHPDKIELGKLCVVFVDIVPHRAEIIHIFPKKKVLDNETYLVRLIDVGDILKKSRPDLFKIDHEFEEFPMQAYIMHLTGIQPSNCEHDWSSKSIRVFQNRIKKLEKEFQNILYDARVIFSLRNAFVVDKIRATDTINIIGHLRLEKELVDMKLGISCLEVVAQIKRIAAEAGVSFEKKVELIEDNPTKVEVFQTCKSSKESVTSDRSDNSIASEKQKLHSNMPAKLNKSSANANVEKDLIDFSIGSHWETEPWDEEPTEKEFREKWTSPPSIKRGRIFISNFYSPDNFYINYHTIERQELERAIEKHINNLGKDPDCSIECPDIGEYCLVNCDGKFNRGKIIGVDYSDISIKIFCVDTGAVVTTGLDHVYDLPDYLLKELPFQANWCRLAGILPKNDIWSSTDSDLVYDEIDKYHETLYAYRVPDTPSIKSKFFDINIFRSDVVLVATEDADQINLNILLASVDLVKIDDEFDIKLMNEIPFVEVEEDWNSLPPNTPNAPDTDTYNALQCPEVESDIDVIDGMFVNFTDEELVEFLRQQDDQHMQAIEPALKAIEPAMQTKPKPKESIETDFNEKTIQLPPKEQLIYNHKRPMVCWRQDKQWIILTIKADDQIKYNLQVTEDYLIYSTIQNDDEYKAVINFFGCIEPQFTKHVLRGLNVVVRLKKSTFWMWPRFTRSAYKCSWITSNLERMVFDEAAKEEYYEDAMKPIMKELNEIERRSTGDSDGGSDVMLDDEFDGDSDDEDY